MAERRQHIIHGLRDGIPIAMGYFAVTFSLGIIAARAGLTAPKGFHRVTLICDESYPKLVQLYTSYGFVPEDTILFFETLCRKMSLSI